MKTEQEDSTSVCKVCGDDMSCATDVHNPEYTVYQCVNVYCKSDPIWIEND